MLVLESWKRRLELLEQAETLVPKEEGSSKEQERSEEVG
jgi:hypothetical protein